MDDCCPCCAHRSFDLKVRLYSAMFVFPALGVGFLLIGLAIGAGIGFTLARVLNRTKTIHN